MIGDYSRDGIGPPCGPGHLDRCDSLPFCGTLQKGTAGRNKLSSISFISREMACMLHSFPWANCHGKADNMVTEVKSQYGCMVTPMDFRQAMLASESVQQKSVAPGNCYPLYQLAPEADNIETTIVHVPEKFIEYILNEGSALDNSNSEIESALIADTDSELYNSLDLDQESQPLIVDCGATTTLTSTLFNMSNVKEKVIDIQMAGKGSVLYSSHSGDKTYHVLDVTGFVRSITTKAYYVRDLKRDLLGGRALTKSGFRVILDNDPEICGVYPVMGNEINPITRMEFISGSALFCLQSIKISSTRFVEMDGFN